MTQATKEKTLKTIYHIHDNDTNIYMIILEHNVKLLVISRIGYCIHQLASDYEIAYKLWDDKYYIKLEELPDDVAAEYIKFL